MSIKFSCVTLRHMSFVEVDVSVNYLIGLGKGSGSVPVDTLRFEDGEEILRHGIVIRISFP